MIIGALQTRLEEHHESNILHRRHRVSGQKSFGRVDAGNHPPFTFSLSVCTRHWIDQALKTHARLRRLGEDEYASAYSPIYFLCSHFSILPTLSLFLYLVFMLSGIDIEADKYLGMRLLGMRLGTKMSKTEGYSGPSHPNSRRWHCQCALVPDPF